VIVVSEWDGSTAKALRKALRMSQERFAEHLGVGVRTVRDWEAAGLKLTPIMVHQEALDTALERASDEQRRRFESLCRDDDAGRASSARRHQLGESPPPSGFTAPLVSDEASERIAAHIGRRDRVDTGLVAAVEDFTHVLAGVNSATRPDILIGPVASHADLILGWLDRPMSETSRRRLDVAAVESHIQTAILAFLGGDRTTSRRYFAVARAVADESGNPTLITQTLAASSVLHSSIPQGGQGGNTRRAVALLNAAAEHACSSDAPTRAWVHRWLAMELAAAGDERGFRIHMEGAEQAQSQSVGGRRGYFACGGGFEQTDPIDTATNLGIGLVLLGHADEAINALHGTLTVGRPRRNVIVLVETAAARLLQGEPEEAAGILLRARVLALEAGYPKGVERIQGVRARAPRRYSRLPCMRALDEQLRA
jgi:transcriptional regulator with XRE-family HTH domain